MQVTVEQIESEVKLLSKKDLEKVKSLVDSILQNGETKPTKTEEEFAQHLYEKGIIGKPPPPITDFSRYDDYKPVTVTGEPISETIIRERR